MNKQIFLITGIIATLGVMATAFLNSQVQAVPKECAGNPHDGDSGPSGNPHDVNETGNPHDAAAHGGGHHHEGADICPGAK